MGGDEQVVVGGRTGPACSAAGCLQAAIADGRGPMGRGLQA